MLQVRPIDGHFVVIGYPDGSDWIFEGGGRFGTIGPDKGLMWQLNDSSVRLFDLARRLLVKEIECGPIDVGKAGACTTADGKQLYLVHPLKNEQNQIEGSELIVVDLDRGAVVARKSGLPGNYDHGFEVMSDGALLLAGLARGDDGLVSLFTRVDLNDFSTSESALVIPRIPDGYKSIRWFAHSPGGKWWLRLDHTHLPMVEHSPYPGAAARKYYGLTMQIWSAFPLRFERRVVVAWLKAEDLPDATRIWDGRQQAAPAASLTPTSSSPPLGGRLRAIFGRRGLPSAGGPGVAQDPREAAMVASAPERDRIWSHISAVLTRPAAVPDGPFPDRSQFGAEAVADDAVWKGIKENLEELIDRRPHVLGWQDDSEAVWIERVGFLICVGMDGTASPRLWSERFGLKKSMMVPFANAPTKMKLLPCRKMIAGTFPTPGVHTLEPKEGGAFMIDGAPVADAYEPVMIPMADDGWETGADALPADVIDEYGYKRRIYELKEKKSVIRVPLASNDGSGRAAALAQLTAIIDHNFAKRANDHTIDIGFTSNGRSTREKKFFETIGPADREWAVPALRSLVERFLDCVPPGGPTLYNKDDDGLFGTAVLRLGELDATSLPLIRRYGERMDGGHEYYFAGTTVPALIRAHGWTEDMIDLVLWMLIFNFYNTYDTPVTVWRDLGLSKALEAKTPEAVAERVVRNFAADVEAKRLDWEAIGFLNHCLGDNKTAWEARFFDALERLAPGSTAH
jgi:hypothetical protein